MGRRILNRKEMRADFDAAERRGKEEVESEEEEEEEEGDEDEDEEDEDQEGGDEDKEEAEGDEDDEEAVAAPPPKKKKKAPPAKPRARTRTAKVTRMRVVWGVFNNSNSCVATYEYPKKEQAIEHAAKLTADKRSTHFIQPVKEAMEAKKEKEK